jgi:hypothetical protein
MNSYLFLAVRLAPLGFLAFRAGRIWVDASRRGFGLARRLRWTLLGAIAPSRYWWKARIEEALSPHEQADLLAQETAALGLSRADGLRCPLCNAEVPHAWVLAPDGRPTVAPRPHRMSALRLPARFMPPLCPFPSRPTSSLGKPELRRRRPNFRALQSVQGMAAGGTGLHTGNGPPTEGPWLQAHSCSAAYHG